jgi:hypothetical protein
MPLVTIIRDNALVNDLVIKELVAQLPAIVAYALDVPEEPNGRLSLSDIEVLVREKHHLDANNAPLAIVICSADFPGRRKNLDNRKKRIIDDIKIAIPPEVHGFVWVLLAPSSFGEF